MKSTTKTNSYRGEKRKMKNLLPQNRIRTKIMFGFSIVILLVLGLSVYSFISINKMNYDMENVMNEQLPLLLADENIEKNLISRVSAAQNYLIFGDKKYKEQFDQYTEESKEFQELILHLNDTEEIRELIDKTVSWRELVIEVFNLYDQGNEEEAINFLTTQVTPLTVELKEGYRKMATSREEIINNTGIESIASGNSTILIVTIISILVLVLGTAIGFITSQKISKPIIQVMKRMKLLAAGDLSKEPLQTKSQDEVGQLVLATNEAMNNTRDLLSQINVVSETVTSQSEELTQSANEVKAGSEQIAVTMQEMASGSESLAESSSTLASTMDNFSSKMQEANSNGESVYESSNKVLKLTEEGSQLMEVSVQQMATIDQIVQESVQKVKGLDTQSQNISKLVSVIQDIAAQTNLLALNAAIEAARAGEHGRGFAVVADEVRKLAEQVSVSVSDITGIVSSIQNESTIVAESLQIGYEEVAKGTTQIKTTGETFNAIDKAITDMVSNIQTITMNLTTMSNDTSEMSATIQEIASISEESAAGVEQTSASTEQTSSTMEEVARSSEGLSKIAEELNGLVRRFNV